MAGMTARTTGLSPLARGNRGQHGGAKHHHGPIPARAGEPNLAHWCTGSTWAYPRSRGGTEEAYLDRVKNSGLSPLARGNRVAR